LVSIGKSAIMSLLTRQHTPVVFNFFLRLSPDVIYVQLCTSKVVGV
jgi:hypothetical protein